MSNPLCHAEPVIRFLTPYHRQARCYVTCQGLIPLHAHYPLPRGEGVFLEGGERKGAFQEKTKPRVSQLLLSSSPNFISIT